jgi:cysteine-rich repeat protein
MVAMPTVIAAQTILLQPDRLLTAGHEDFKDSAAQVSASNDCVWLAVWSARQVGENTSDIYTARSNDCGVSWSEPGILNTDAGEVTGSDHPPAIENDGAGSWIIVWLRENESGDAELFASTSRDNAITWSDPVRLSVEAPMGLRTRVLSQEIAYGDTTWIVVWYYQTIHMPWKEDFRVVTSRTDDFGENWTVPQPILDPASPLNARVHYDPAIAHGSAGNWLAAWATWGETDLDATAGLGQDEDLLYAVSTDAGVSWSEALPLNATATSDQDWDGMVTVAPDLTGGWIAAWVSQNPLNGTIGSDLDILTAHLSDGAESWSEPVSINPDAASDALHESKPQLVADQSGAWIALWQENSTGIVVLAVSSDAGVNWGNFTEHPTTSSDPTVSVATDQEGNFGFTWHVTGNFCYDLGCTSVGDSFFVPFALCGDSLVSIHEECDDGNTTDSDGCDSNCTPTGCGNGVVTGLEECDDGNTTNGDGCDNNCTVSRCGNEVVAPDEECDNGQANNDTLADACREDCTFATCQDGVIDSGEACDDGNWTDGDSCTNNCTVARCGDGSVYSGFEECDTAGESPTCDSDCTFAFCGDGTVNSTAGENCEDGNTSSGDCCDSNCVTEDSGAACEIGGGTCTPDFCDGSGTCQAGSPIEDGTSCNDGFVCTLGDQCSDGVCTSGAQRDCSHFDDGCLRGVCDEDIGECVVQALSDPLLCDDLNVCTFDSCDQDLGCQHVAVLGPCDDGDSCTTSDSCAGGNCDGEPIVGCGVTTTTTTTTTTSTTTTTVPQATTTTTIPESPCGNAVPDLGATIETVAGRLITATDALAILQAAVGLSACDLCVCDVDGSGVVSAVDALAALNHAVGNEVELRCPVCE